MKICLVLPNYGPGMTDDPCCYPLGFQYVSSMYRAYGFDVKVLNFNLFDYDLKEELKGQDLVCMTGYEQFLPENEATAAVARPMGIRTVLGGAMATFNADEVCRIFDGVFSGEMGAATPINRLPLPDYDGFGIAEYNRRHSVRYIGVLTSRGCPFSCSFCSSVCKFRERDLTGVSAEIDLYKVQYGIEYVVFNDNTLNITKARFLSVCDMARAAKVAWSAAIRADVFDEDMAVAAKNSGCQYFVVGVESFRQERLDRMNKRLKVEQTISTLDLLSKYDIDYHGNIILGLDNETVDDITEEIEELPQGYKLYPVLAQSFAGTNVKSSLSEDQRGLLNSIFAAYAEKQGKYTYAGVK